MKDKILIGLFGLFGLAMVAAGAMKFVPMQMSAEDAEKMAALAKLGWLLPLVGVAEIVGGILIAIPKTRAVGALVLLPITVGIFAHIFTNEPGEIALGAIFLIIDLVAIVDSKEKYMPMIA